MQKRKLSSAVLLTALLSLLYFTSYITRLNFSASIAEMVSAGVFTKPEAGVIGTALFFAYGFGQIISGILSDKFEPGKIVTLGLVLTTLCNLFFPLFSSPAVMAAVWGVNGFAQALFWPPIVRILSHYYTDSGYTKGTLAVSYSCHAATILIYVIVPVSIRVSDWRLVFFLSSLLAVTVLTVWCIAYPRLIRRLDAAPQDTAPVSENKSTSLFGVLVAAGVPITMVAIAIMGYLKDGIQSWLPTFFTEVFSMDAADAILINVLLPVANIAFVSVAAFLYRRVFRNELTGSAFLFGVTALLSVLLAVFYKASPVVSLILAAIIAGCTHGINALLISFLPRRFERVGKAATVSGLCNACVYLGSAASSYGVALTASCVGWFAALASWGALSVVGVLVCVLCFRKWRTYIKQG